MPWVYPVHVTGAGRSVLIDQPGNYLKSRKLAEEVASFMGLGVSDQSSGTEIVREARTLDVPLVHRDLRSQGEIPIPTRPALPKTSIKSSGGTLHIDIEPPGFQMLDILGNVGGFIHSLILSLFLYYFIFIFAMMIISNLAPEGSFESLDNVSMNSFCLLGIVLSVCVAMYLSFKKDVHQSMVRNQIEISPNYLTLKRSSRFERQTRSIPINKLEELQIRDSSINAIGDNTIIIFGSGLDEPEQQWLVGVIKHFINHKKIPEMPEVGVCPRCGRKAEFMETYNSWYCHECRDYV